MRAIEIGNSSRKNIRSRFTTRTSLVFLKNFISTILLVATTFTPLAPAYALNFADEAARDALRLGSDAGRGAAAEVSDYLLTGLTVLPIALSAREGLMATPKTGRPLLPELRAPLSGKGLMDRCAIKALQVTAA